MRILALDQASRITGWAIFDGGELIEYGAIDASRYSDLGDRLYTLRNSVKNIITEFKIDKVILEDIFLDEQKVNNIQTFKVLAEVFGVLYELCVELKIPVEAVLAGTWKSSLHIKGRTRPEQKKSAREWVLNNYNIKTVQDAADAICIGAHILRQSINNWDDE